MPDKPPLGLVPKEIKDSIRLGEIIEAMARYHKFARDIPEEWVVELQELIQAGAR